MLASMLEPQAPTVLFQLPSTGFSLLKVSLYSRMAAGTLAITSTSQTGEKRKGERAEKILCQLRSALFEQPTWNSHTVLLTARPNLKQPGNCSLVDHMSGIKPGFI